uniref:Uncharacterized protein n=1 Tax=Lactuca sativa TaxID=4236 RepID=A0A9R1XTT1_LACSA|nr:hypothetical protein LSAT_V11C100035190 [Lactuca sativa]
MGTLSLGFNEQAKRATLMSSFIMHNPHELSNFTEVSLKIVSYKNTKKHGVDYVDPHHTAEEERDIIEHLVSAFVQPYKEQIGILKTSITDEDANGQGWLGIMMILFYIYSSFSAIIVCQLTIVRFLEDLPTVHQQVLDDDTCALQSVEATKNVEMRNKELTQANKRNNMLTFHGFFILFLTFTILFLDWYN